MAFIVGQRTKIYLTMETKTYKIIAFSDSHEDNNIFEKLLPIINSADYCFFLGDGYKSVLKREKEIKAEFHAVRGNCDFVCVSDEKIVKINECEFLLTHGHNYDVKSTLNRIYFSALEKKCSYALFGHTHNPLVFANKDVTLINPGSLRYSNNGESNYAVITGDGISFTAEIMTLKKN